MNTIHKNELIQAVSQKANLSKASSEKAVNALLEALTDSLLAGDKVQLHQFGTFEVKERPAHEGINPRTKQAITIPAKKVLAFKASAAWKNKL